MMMESWGLRCLQHELHLQPEMADRFYSKQFRILLELKYLITLYKNVLRIRFFQLIDLPKNVDLHGVYHQYLLHALAMKHF